MLIEATAALVVVIAVILTVAAMKPDSFRVERKIVIKASPFMSKVMCVFMNMDKMIGREFEKSLLDLKALVEGRRASRA
jgi:hypothetical protein